MWIIKEQESHEIMSCNIHKNKDTNFFELWATRPNNRSVKITESENLEDVSLVKEAIDYTIEEGQSALRLPE
jgi:hypothetical protein